ncbi:AraC family transcriptional regulator [Variovorax sp. KK3]|uniref:AraC family transcriptional regulator n=1 Tax=Variovorax sp. KK3 TaxID=1855728 RepID=UPI002118592C|nr:AraC family transcriptional regulator [Variovorax sp. KK3]
MANHVTLRLAMQQPHPHPPPLLRPPATVPIVFVQGMLSGVPQASEMRTRCLVDVGIAPELLDEPGARVTAEQYHTLFRLLMDRLDDECLGLLSRRLKRGSLAMLVRAAAGAPTLQAAIRRVAHIFRLLQDDVTLQPVRAGDGANELAGLAIRLVDPAARTYEPFLHELLLRILWRLCAWLVGGQLPAARFDFAFNSPSYASQYGKVFPATLHFGCKESAFWFAAGRLADPIRRDDAAVRAFLADAQAQMIVPRRGNDAVGARVREHLQRTMPAWPDLGATAGAMSMSASTLQRKLAAEGTSFQSLKDELRRDMAIVRLNTSSVPLAQLAYDLGFADSPAFQRAFKGWTGSAAGAYRKGAG